MDVPLNFLLGYSQREIEFIAKEEKVIHLDDFFLRRSMLAKLGQITNDNLDEISEIINNALDWSDEKRNQEIHRTRTLLKGNHGVVLE